MEIVRVVTTNVQKRLIFWTFLSARLEHISFWGGMKGGDPPLFRGLGGPSPRRGVGGSAPEARFSRLTVTSNRASFPLLAFFIMAFLGSDRASFVHVNLDGPLIAFVHVNLGRPSIAWLCSCERAEAPLL